MDNSFRRLTMKLGRTFLCFSPAAVVYAWTIDPSLIVSRGQLLLHYFAQSAAGRTIFDLGSRRILVAALVIVVQAILIFALLFERNRKNRAARKLAESEERFARVFRANPQPMLLMTLTGGRFIDVNESFLTLSGYARNEIMGRTSEEIGLFSSEAQRKATVGLIMQTGSARDVELHCPMKNGDVRVLLCSAELIELAGEKCVIIACSDITERKESEQQLAQLSGRLLRTQDEERRRIARELHDVTAQSIGLMMLNLAQVQNAASALDARSKEKLAESMAFGEQALKDIRTLSYILHPPLLDQAGLTTALKWYVKGFHERSGVKVEFTESGIDEDRMPPEVEYALFRVVQECLTNIRRHTDSEAAEINLTRTEDTVSLSVRDHGKGQDFQLTGNGDGAEFVGVGIPGMRHRLKQLGGELQVDSSLEGTTVIATVPVRWGNDSHSLG